jgi:MYXO-CTERM domain-containing protein
MVRRVWSQVVGWFVVFAASSAASAQLVSHWRGEGNASDSAGSNHGTIVGTVNYAPGMSGRAFHFPDDGYINIPNPGAGGLVSPAGFTFAAWVRLDGADPPPKGGPGAIVSYATAPTPGDSNGFMIMPGGASAAASPISFIIATTGEPGFTVLQTPFPVWSFGQFHHLAATFDAATHTMAVYRNGQLEAIRSDVPGTTMATNSAATFDLGRAPGIGSTLDGVLDEARFYDRALSASEIQTLVPEPGGAAVAGLLALAALVHRSRRRR